MFNVNFTLSELVKVKSELNFLSGLVINQNNTYIGNALDTIENLIDEKLEEALDCIEGTDKDDF